METNKKAGITTTIPAEVLLAAGIAPVDLNNVYITSSERDGLVASAEARGFPPNVCTWIKGIYAAACRANVDFVVGVVRGDCSSTEKLLEIWNDDGLSTVPFSFPASPDTSLLHKEIAEFAGRVGTTIDKSEQVRQELLPLRSLLSRLDELTFRDNKVLGQENHLWLVSSSDFNGLPQQFEDDLVAFLAEAERRPSSPPALPIGYAGVPSVIDDLYETVEGLGGRIVFNEVQRQFSMPGSFASLAEQYAAYTYPFDTFHRITDIRREIERRGLKGIIHYSQTFCHRQLESMLFRKHLPVPVLTIEADKPGPVTGPLKTRLEAFLEQLSQT
jgi:benzoyl-CoA reductase/2-hydroxyglutaryl-CoA dehydratase subunit BcrC/BadD/HgdB